MGELRDRGQPSAQGGTDTTLHVRFKQIKIASLRYPPIFVTFSVYKGATIFSSRKPAELINIFERTGRRRIKRFACHPIRHAGLPLARITSHTS